MILRFFYTYRHYSYILAVLMVLGGFYVSHRLSAGARRDLDKRLAILPAPVWSEDPKDLEDLEVTLDGSSLVLVNRGKGTVYAAEFFDPGRGREFTYEDKPLGPGEKGRLELPEGTEKVELKAAGIDK
ncbi:MAG: hypothetical protein IJT95_04695 [Abditibacteriota bacterium]|nr:hypothetical protein [Abditibacteriota bacterium]